MFAAFTSSFALASFSEGELQLIKNVPIIKVDAAVIKNCFFSFDGI